MTYPYDRGDLGLDSVGTGGDVEWLGGSPFEDEEKDAELMTIIL